MNAYTVSERAWAEALAEQILNAAGSGLRHYIPATQDRIISVATAAIRDIKNGEERRMFAGNKK